MNQAILFKHRHATDDPPEAASKAIRPWSLVVEGVDVPVALASQASIESAVLSGLRSVAILETVSLGKPGHAWTLLRLIRDLTGCSVSVTWELDEVDATACWRHFISFRPPANLPNTSARAWVAAYTYGALFWRAGPGFAMIRDARGDAVQLFTLDEPEYFEAVRLLHAGLPTNDSHRDAIEALVSEGLVIRLGDRPLLLPYRMRHWPVSFDQG